MYQTSDRHICGHPVEFSVEGRKVSARICDCASDALSYIYDLTSIMPRYDHCCMIDIYSASAVCHSNDVFDEEVGKRIAYRRLLKKYLIARNKRIARFVKTLESSRGVLRLRHYKAAQHILAIDPEYGIK